MQRDSIQPQKKWDGTEELHTALKQSREIGSATSLYQFVSDIKSKYDVQIPREADLEALEKDERLQRFMKSVILCTEYGYDESQLTSIVKCPFKLDYKQNYMKLLDKVVKELIDEGKTQHLQTYGYVNDKANAQQNGKSLQSLYINLNKSQFITREWEKVYIMLGDLLFQHIYKYYIIFFKTKDDSLVQVSGTNIFFYLSEKFGKSSIYQQPPENNESLYTPKQVSDSKSHKYNLKTNSDMYQINQPKQQWEMS